MKLIALLCALSCAGCFPPGWQGLNIPQTISTPTPPAFAKALHARAAPFVQVTFINLSDASPMVAESSTCEPFPFAKEGRPLGPAFNAMRLSSSWSVRSFDLQCLADPKQRTIWSVGAPDFRYMCSILIRVNAATSLPTYAFVFPTGPTSRCLLKGRTLIYNYVH